MPFPKTHARRRRGQQRRQQPYGGIALTTTNRIRWAFQDAKERLSQECNSIMTLSSATTATAAAASTTTTTTTTKLVKYGFQRTISSTLSAKNHDDDDNDSHNGKENCQNFQKDGNSHPHVSDVRDEDIFWDEGSCCHNNSLYDGPQNGDDNNINNCSFVTKLQKELYHFHKTTTTTTSTRTLTHSWSSLMTDVTQSLVEKCNKHIPLLNQVWITPLEKQQQPQCSSSSSVVPQCNDNDSTITTLVSSTSSTVMIQRLASTERMKLFQSFVEWLVHQKDSPAWRLENKLCSMTCTTMASMPSYTHHVPILYSFQVKMNGNPILGAIFYHSYNHHHHTDDSCCCCSCSYDGIQENELQQQQEEEEQNDHGPVDQEHDFLDHNDISVLPRDNALTHCCCCIVRCYMELSKTGSILQRWKYRETMNNNNNQCGNCQSTLHATTSSISSDCSFHAKIDINYNDDHDEYYFSRMVDQLHPISLNKSNNHHHDDQCYTNGTGKNYSNPTSNTTTNPTIVVFRNEASFQQMTNIVFPMNEEKEGGVAEHSLPQQQQHRHKSLTDLSHTVCVLENGETAKQYNPQGNVPTI